MVYNIFTERFQMSVRPTAKIEHFILVVFLRLLTFVSGQCSSPLTITASDDFSSVSSPGYSSGSYANDLSCSWIIDSGSSTEIVLIFITNYDVSSPDKIDIHDGFSTSNTTLVSGLSGTGTNTKYKTSGQYALIVFESDSSGQAQGFKAVYMKAKDLSGTGCTSRQTLTATSTTQYLTSPDFPNNYPGQQSCSWIIEASDGTVQFDLLLSDIESSTNCAFDSIKIYDSTYICEYTQTVSACSRYPGVTTTYSSNGTGILVVFVSDATVGYAGFKLRYTSLATTTSSSSGTSSTESSGFGLGIGVGFASGFITALISVGLLFVVKSRVKASQLSSPRVRNVIPMQTPTSLNGNMSQMNGHVPTGEIGNGHLPRRQRISTTSSHSGNSSRNGRTPSTGNSSPLYSETDKSIISNMNNNNYVNNHKRNGILPTPVDH